MVNLTMFDLPEYIKLSGGKVYPELIGVITGEVEPSPNVENVPLLTRRDRFACVDLIGIVADTGMYYIKGKMLVVVDKTMIDACKVTKSGRRAVKLSRGKVTLGGTGVPNTFVTMCNWKLDSNNAWKIFKCKCELLDKNSYPEFYEVIARAYANNWEYDYGIKIFNSYKVASEGYEFKYVDENSKALAGVVAISGVVDTAASVSAPLMNTQKISPDVNIGVSDKANIDTLVNNMVYSANEKTRLNKFMIENRDKIKSKSKNVALIEKAIESADEKVAKTLLELQENYSTGYEFDDAISFCGEKLIKNWKKSVGVTGRRLFKEALEKVMPEYAIKGENGESLISNYTNILGGKLVEGWVASSFNDIIDKENESFLDDLLLNRECIYLKIIEMLLGIRDRLCSAYAEAKSENIDMMYILKTNPYNLCFIDPRITIEDLDKLAMLYNIDITTKDIKVARNVAYMHNFMLDSNNYVVQSNTLIKLGTLVYKVAVGYIFGKRNYDNILATGYIINTENIEILKYYINPELEESRFQLPKEGWKPVGKKYVLQGKTDVKGVLKDYIDSGLGINVDLNGSSWVADYVYAKKEMYIYNRLYELNDNTYTRDVSDEEIEECIKEFEDLKTKQFGLEKSGGFKLEERQKSAVYLVKNPVMCLTGPAGSGKTTTAEVLVYALQKILDYSDNDIMFCAPTGKAANRLKEVVRRRTRTINSLFGISSENLGLAEPANIKKRDDLKAIIIDESSMINLNLMYNMLIRIEDGTRIFFLGDIKQLAPIGPGKPFANLLSFLPCVALNVSKRAASSSYIAKNNKILLGEEGNGIQELQNGPDYRIIHTTDEEEVVSKVISIAKYHLGLEEAKGFTPVKTSKVNPSDIQVITPVNGRIWGTKKLNTLLQDIFNPKGKKDIAIRYARSKDNVVEFRMHDRVIHTTENKRTIHLIQHAKGSFVHGGYDWVMNGDVGEVVGVYKSDELDFSLEDDENLLKALEKEYKYKPNMLYLAVEYKDIEFNTGAAVPYIVLYGMEMLLKEGNTMTVLSRDLSNLDLAYALTVHKLQGSQAKITIFVLLPVGKGDFISLNMIYTGNSRATDSNYIIGDVLGRDSCVAKGRLIEQSSKRVTLMDNI